jgi:hypothetical protein
MALKISNVRVAIVAGAKEVNFRAVILLSVVCAGAAVAVYFISGFRGVTLVLGWFIGPIIGLFLGLIWPAVRRIMIRAGSSLEIGEYFTFAGSRFPLKVLDGPVTYQPQELVFRMAGDLRLPEFLASAHDHMRERMESYRGQKVLFDGQCFVLDAPPLIRRSWSNERERPTIVADFRKTTYFIRVLCRDALSGDLRAHIEEGWPQGVPNLSDIRRAAISLSDDFSPFLHPGAGLNLCLVAYDRVGRPWTLVQRRGSGIAEETGKWATSLHEGFAPDDLTGDNLIDPFLTAQRAAREELGISLTKIEFFVTAIDEGSLPGQPVTRSGGFELIGSAETSLAAERLQDTRFRGRDKFEAAELVTLEMSVPSILQLLRKEPPETWFTPALVALIETLERLKPGSWYRLSSELEGMPPRRRIEHSTEQLA